MPSSLFTLDSELPTLSVKDSPQVQIQKMYNYLVQMRQSLQYSLRNLTTDNFSASALQNLTDGAKGEIADKINLMQSSLSQLSGKYDSISSRVSAVEGLSGDVDSLVESIELLAAEVVALQEDLERLDTAITGEGGILQRLENAEKILSVINIGEDGSIVIGTDEAPLHLLGVVHINGEVYGGDTNEIT